MTDTLGLLLAVRVHPADVQDRDGAESVVERAVSRCKRLKKLYADAAYAGALAQRIERRWGLQVQIVRRGDDKRGSWSGPGLPPPAPATGFVVQPKRWVIERTHAWSSRPRRLAKDYELRLEISEAWLWLVQARLLLRRLAWISINPAGHS
jgi:transposase